MAHDETLERTQEQAARDQERTDELAALLLLAAVGHERFAADMTARVMEHFRQMERDLVTAVIDSDVLGHENPQRQKSAANALANAGEDIVLDTYDTIIEEIEADLRALAEATEGSVVNALIMVFGPEYAVKFLRTVPVETLHEIADGALFEGATTEQWFVQQAGDSVFRFRRAMTEAAANAATGLSIDDVVETIRGSRESRRTDGIFQQPRRNAEVLLRTVVQAVATAVRRASFEANPDTVAMVGQQSVLDSRTSEICIAYSSKRWRLPGYEPVGHSLPFNGGTPRHWRCRSQIIPLIGNADVPGWTYEEWLNSRSEDEQRDILGAAKWELWRSHRLSLSETLDQRGNPLGVSELIRRFGRRQPD